MDKLPYELILEILSNLEVKDVSNFCHTSKLYLQVFQDWSFWADKANVDLGLTKDSFVGGSNPIRKYFYLRNVYDLTDGWFSGTKLFNRLVKVVNIVDVDRAKRLNPIISELKSLSNLTIESNDLFYHIAVDVIMRHYRAEGYRLRPYYQYIPAKSILWLADL